MTYKIYKDRTGNVRVKHQCPHCNEAIENEISEAGGNDTCPACGKAFVVPGKAEREKLETELANAATLRKQAEERAKQLAEEQAKKIAAARKSQALEATVVPPMPEFKPLPPWEPPKKTPVKRRGSVMGVSYPALEAYQMIFRIAGWLCLASFAVITVLLAYAAIQEDDFATAIGATAAAAVPIAIIALPASLTCFVSAEAIELAIEARRDLAKLVDLARILAEK